MKISPMEIQRQVFAVRWRGFDRDEVRTYLAFVAEELATLQRERDQLSQELQSVKAVVEDYKHRESILKNTLLTAQRVSEEIRENARRHAEGIVKESEIQADRVIELAQNRARQVERDLVDLRLQRQTVRSEMRSFLERMAALLEIQEEAETEDNVHFLQRRREEA
jgi:cell division initiation protein